MMMIIIIWLSLIIQVGLPSHFSYPLIWNTEKLLCFSGQFHKFALNLAQCSSKEMACLNMCNTVLDVVNGSAHGINPTELTVSLKNIKIKSQRKVNRKKNPDKTNQTPTNSISTLLENVFLNAVNCLHPSSVVEVYILYAKGTCWSLYLGRRLILWIMPAKLFTHEFKKNIRCWTK